MESDLISSIVLASFFTGVTLLLIKVLIESVKENKRLDEVKKAKKPESSQQTKTQHYSFVD